ncbi:hypothetical protein O0L34_g8034 [Tuta absoluta]|nr:hypothetical protein O0L34_g8034 [Tuta absoluta]
MFAPLLFILLTHNVSAHIISLSKSDYARMPPVFNLDRYEPCLHENNGSGIYCRVKFHVFSEGPNELYDMMKNYSNRRETHFNHTQLTYGICLTRTCKSFYNRETAVDLGETLKECLNKTFWKDYNLQTQVTEDLNCETLEEGFKLDNSDYAVAAVIFVILVVNIVGSLQDFALGPENEESPFLACFSIRHNWRRMIAPAGEGPEPRLSRLKGFYGIKALNIMLVVMCHSVMPATTSPNNTRYIEEALQQFPVMSNGTLVVQSFFVMSGFLLVYNMLLEDEKRKITWTALPKAILNRWLRLTPAYMVVLAITATWFRHFGSGPMFKVLVGDEAQDCRRDWWLHPLYVNNYFDNSYCMMHTWYIAADFQLYCLGVAVFVLTKGCCRKVLLGLLFVLGVVMPAAHTYLQDLDGVLILAPETTRNLLLLDPTFNHTYKRGHTNLASFIIGISVAFFVYQLQNNEKLFLKINKFRTVFLLSVPAAVGLNLVGNIFFMDAPRASIYIRTACGGLLKPMFGAVVGVVIVGMVCKFENVYRGILEWSGWAPLARVSYCAYIIHVIFVKVINGTRTTLVHLSFLNFLQGMTSLIIISWLAAVPLHLLVEAPGYQLVKLCTSGRRTTPQQQEKSADAVNSRC